MTSEVEESRERRTAIRNLPERDRERRAGDYFDGFPWEPQRADPRRMTAADFLRILD
ncbi:MAG: hypothetical protein KC731_15595 [Myxococcales bacterium]|nr:hypothetical protein [Myxococcales bacterium]